MPRFIDYLESGRTYLIAELSANHGGSLETALETVREAKKAGADCLKIQTYTADTMTLDSRAECFRIHGGLWDGYTLYDLYREASMPWEWQTEIKAACEREGIDFLSTPFDKTAVDFLDELGTPCYKIASFELVDLPLIAYAAAKRKPMILSTGMADYREISEAVETVRRQGNNQIVLLKCSSTYPAAPEDLNLRTLRHMRESFGVSVGFSDHSMGSACAVAAVAVGARVIEKHFCLSREIKSPDAAFSMEPAEFRAMAGDIRTVEKALGTVRYACSETEQKSLKFRRSIFAVRDIRAGEVFTEENIRCIRPGDGIKPKYYGQLLGRRAERAVAAGTPMRPELVKDRKALFGEPFQLRRAEPDDLTLLFDWAGDPEVRRNSFHTEPISFEEHEAWFQARLNDSTTPVYILEQDGEPVGQIRFQIEDSCASVSYNVTRENRGKGYGRKLVELAEERLTKDYPQITVLSARVKAENNASKAVFIKNGYALAEKGDVCTYRKQIVQ